MFSDKFGNPVYQINDLVEMIYAGQTSFDMVLVEDSEDILKFETNSNLTLTKISDLNNDMSLQEFDKVHQDSWFIPEEYKILDIEALLLSRCPKENVSRLTEELVEFKKRNMLLLLNVLMYLVDTFRKNNVVWGVGRGSSVSSYALYLLEVHRIDSVKYGLDWQDFLR